jgi:predicted protein tyrosine phosphatase
MLDSSDRLVPFEITVCGIGELGSRAVRGVSHVLSILDPRIAERPSFAAFGPHRRLELCFDDILEHRQDLLAPQRSHVDDILELPVPSWLSRHRMPICSCTVIWAFRGLPPPWH